MKAQTIYFQYFMQNHGVITAFPRLNLKFLKITEIRTGQPRSSHSLRVGNACGVRPNNKKFLP